MTNPTNTSIAAFSTEVAALVRRTAPSVVSVQTKRSRSSGFAWRTGFIVAAEGALAEDADIVVVAHDGAKSPARLVGRDPTTDVVVLAVERQDLKPALVDAASPSPGELAIVVGAGDNGPTAALGVVGVSGPQWRSLRGGLIDARIELDAALRRSSEGGLALDAEGRAIGMAVFGPRRRTLVIPLATIERAAGRLQNYGRVARGYLGLGLKSAPLDGGGVGAIAISVDPTGPGAAAGILQGDIVVAWNGEAIGGVPQLSRLLGPDSVGTTVKLALRRAGEPREAAVVIGERPQG